MPRIILSLALITLVTGALAFGATNAFFSDSEVSTANVFTAGSIDLKVDNSSYYNGVFNPATSWEPLNLDESTKFFDFDDLKPDDFGEDTISLHVETNDAYMNLFNEMTIKIVKYMRGELFQPMTNEDLKQ